MKTKRLFVGGLYSDISEMDLRARFKTFGTVSSVEIKRRTDEKGSPIKTFAYIDILQTETDFRRCVSLLTNSKWKGCHLKIQAAKESFLTRLERERQEKDRAIILSPSQDTQNEAEENRKLETPKQNSIPETLLKAVPGTPLPGKKNWVVGKFGRVLPVVYLRRKDRKKIAKFDPSKTTHCLKKIRAEESAVAVSELTWNLESDDGLVNGSSVNLLNKKGKKQKKLKRKETDDSTIGFGFNNGIEKHERNTSEVETVLNETNSNKLSASIDDDFKSDSCASHSTSDTEHRHPIKKLKKNALSTNEGNSSDTSDTSAASTPTSGDVSPIALNKNSISGELNTAEQNKRKLRSDNNEFESTSNTKLQNINNSLSTNLNSNDTEPVEDYDLSDENSLTSSGGKSSDSCGDASDTESNASEDGFNADKDQLSSAIDKKRSDIGPDPNNRTCKVLPVIPSKSKSESKAIDNPHKQKHSNEKRLDALQEKKKSVLAQRNLIKDALKDLDSSPQSRDGKKHIVFSEDEEEGDCGDNKAMKKSAYSVGDKISGSKASSWLGLDSDSDEQEGSDDDDQNEQLVTVKPQFEGKAGEELFKLQRTFGGDKRFELDSRFLESEEEEDHDRHAYHSGDYEEEAVTSDKDYEETVSTQKDDEISRSLAKEKEMALKVLSNILGGDFRAEHDSRESQEKVLDFRGSTVVHYDPDREDHKQFEQSALKKTEKQETKKPVQEKQSEEPVLPEVSQDKYHHVNTASLADLFGNKNQIKETKGTSFTFLSHDPEDDADTPTEEQGHFGAVEEIKTNPWQTASKLPYDSSDDNDEDMDSEDAVDDGTQSSKSTSHLDELFFFHPNDPKLANRINDKETPFMRTGSQEDVNEYWVSVRSELTQDYKRKRKDAVRRQNKLAAKRTRHR